MTLVEDGALPYARQNIERAVTEKVFIYGINYAPEPIGVGRYTSDFGSYLATQGIEVDVVTAVPHYPGWSVRSGYKNRYASERVAGARVIRCPLLLKSKMGGVWRMLAPLSFAIASAPVAIWRILTTRPGTVLCVEPTLFCAPAALLAAKLVGSRTVLHVQDLEIDAAFAVGHLSGGLLERIARWFERMTLRRFDAVVTISNQMRKGLEAKGIAADRLSVVRNWVDLAKIKPLPGRSRFRDELGLVDDDFVVLYSGNIGLKQALHLILEAATRLSEHKELVFVIAGEGPEKRKLLDAYSHLSNVRFLSLQPEEKLCELLNLADVHILPQHSGAADLVLPSKLGGMLASGKPCIVMASCETEMYEFLKGSAVLIEPGKPDLLARAILEMKSGTVVFDHENRLRLLGMIRAEENLKSIQNLIFPCGI